MNEKGPTNYSQINLILLLQNEKNCLQNTTMRWLKGAMQFQDHVNIWIGWYLPLFINVPNCLNWKVITRIFIMGGWMRVSCQRRFKIRKQHWFKGMSIISHFKFLDNWYVTKSFIHWVKLNTYICFILLYTLEMKMRCGRIYKKQLLENRKNVL